MKKTGTGYVLAALGVALAGLGLALGQHGHVLAKAVRICMECVGIG